MAGEGAVPPAPLAHPDEVEHRRQIAIRANAIAYEVGEFTPAFSFATPGDLSVSYSRQKGYYWRIGAVMFVTIDLIFTPTFSTASGAATITGLPYQADTDGPDKFIGTLVGDGSGLSYPSSVDGLFCEVDDAEDEVRLKSFTNGGAVAALDASDFSSGSQVDELIAQIWYAIAR